jgi:hypothetical protein
LFDKIQKAAKSWYKEQFDYEEGGNIYFAGTAAGAGSNKSRLIKLLHDVKIPTINWLTTPVYPLHANNIRELAEAWNEGIDWRTLWNPDSASRTRKNNWGVIQTEAKEPVIKPKIERRPLKQLSGSIELNATITVKEHRNVDASVYPNMTLEQAVKKQAEDMQRYFSKVFGKNLEVSIELTMKNGDKTAEAKAPSDKPKEPEPKKTGYGFF